MATSRLTTSRLLAALAATAAVALLAILVALRIGSVPLDFGALLAGDPGTRTIFFDLRLPRVLLAAVVGAALAVSGAALQPTLRNPLASPEIIGVSGGAAVSAVLALAFLPEGALGAGLVPVVAFAGATASSLIVYQLAHVRGRLDPYTQVLIGVTFNTFAAALILLVHALVDLRRSHSIVFWMMGGISSEPYPVVALAALLVIAATAVLVRDARSLDLLALGDEAARALGTDADAVRRRVFLASSLLVGAVVSLCGIITFAGLVVPHVLRRIVGSDNRLLVPASFFGGAAFLVACDALARWIAAPAELPVGAITALAGAPFFVYLLRRGRSRQGALA
ncbi:MAG TPA: iron ABC transporter permease [Candidatus Binatia bacterium]|jgi:iron complex transport system permease protein